MNQITIKTPLVFKDQETCGQYFRILTSLADQAICYMKIGQEWHIITLLQAKTVETYKQYNNE